MAIAIVGTACRLPGQVTDSDGLWNFLLQGRNAWSNVPSERFSENAFYHPHHEHPGTTQHRGGHFLQQHPGAFDAEFFGISANEAKAIDPQQRLAIEVAYEAFENGGLPIESLRESSTAVFAATFTRDYDRNLLKDTNNLPQYHTTGTGEAILANRISYLFDLKGPSMTIDTGCSGSLVALHQACESIKSGESRMALVVGTNLILGPDTMNGMSNLHMLSDEGRSYSFDSRGKGYGRGEGVVALYLKSLDDALAGGENIYAIIRNTGVNQDGKTNGITLPNRTAQEALVRQVYAQVGLDTISTQYVEAHGTGTAAGDTLELQGIANAFTSGRTGPLYVGSIKSNIGHTESTSGLAGVLKAILALQHNQIPPNADFRKAREKIDLQSVNIIIPKEVTPWPETTIRRASVNSFGYGGTNAHAIIEAASPTILSFNKSHLPAVLQVVNLSAKSEASIKKSIERLGDWARRQDDGNVRVVDIARTLNVHRSALQWRTCVTAKTLADLQNNLCQPPQIYKAKKDPHVVFVFTGQGAQWPQMGCELVSTSYPFAESIAKSDLILKTLGSDWSLLHELQKDAAATRINDSTIAQPASTALQIALVDMLHCFKVQPSMVIGHSSGEIAAAYCAGAISHDTAIKISYYRSQISSLVKDMVSIEGAMLAVGLGETEIAPYLQSLRQGKVTVACVNSPSSVTLSGDQSGIQELCTRLTNESIFNRKLQVDTAYHSHHMQSVAHRYLQSMGDLDTKSPVIHFQSTVDAAQKLDGFSAEYWVANLVSKVRFCDALEKYCSAYLSHRSVDSKTCLFVEIGPHHGLGGPVRQTLKVLVPKLEYTYLSVLVRARDAQVTTQELAAKLWERGVSIDLQAVNALNYSSTRKLLCTLPTYSWDHSKIYWHETRLSKSYLFRKHPPHDLLGVRIPVSTDIEPAWTYHIDMHLLPWLGDHVIDGLVIFPGSGYICMAIEALKQQSLEMTPSDAIRSFTLRDVTFLKALVVLAPPERIELQLRLTARRYGNQVWQEFLVSAVSKDGVWSEHCRGLGFVNTGNVDIAVHEPVTRGAAFLLEMECAHRVSGENLYEQLSYQGNKYGAMFAAVKELKIGDGFAVGSVSIPDIKATMPSQHQQNHVLHPSTLDALMHATLPLYAQKNGPSSIMPASIREIRVAASLPADPGTHLAVVAAVQSTGVISADAIISVFNHAASLESPPQLQIEGLDLRGVGGRPELKDAAFRDMAFEMRWAPDADLLMRMTALANRSSSNGLREGSYESALPMDSGYSSTVSESGVELQFPISQTSLNQFLELATFKRPYMSVLFVGLGTNIKMLSENIAPNLSCYRADGFGMSEHDYSLCRKILKAKTGSLLPLPTGTAEITAYDLIIVLSEANRLLSTADFKPTAVLIDVYPVDSTVREILSPSNNSPRPVANSHGFPLSGAEFPSKYHASLRLRGGDALQLSTQKPVNIVSTRRIPTEAGKQVAAKICADGIPASTVAFGATVSTSALYVIIDYASNSILDKPTGDEFRSIAELVSQASFLIWLSVCGQGSGPTQATSGLVRGFARTCCAEMDELKFVVIDLQDEFSTSLPILTFAITHIVSQSLRAPARGDFETEYLVRDQQILIPRLLPASLINQWISRSLGYPTTATVPYNSITGPVHAEMNIGNPTKNICFAQDTSFKEAADSNYVNVKILYHGLSKRLSSAFMDTVPFETPEPVCQSVGNLTAIGSSVSDFATGDRVAVFGGNPFANLTQTKQSNVFRLTESMSSEVVATSIIPFMEAYRALIEQADLEEGDVLLINSSSERYIRAGVAMARTVQAYCLVIVENEEKASSCSQNLGLDRSQLVCGFSVVQVKADLRKKLKDRLVNVLFNTQDIIVADEFDEFIAKSGFRVSIADLVTRHRTHNTSTGLSCINFDLALYAATKASKVSALFANAMTVMCNSGPSTAPQSMTFPMGAVSEALQAAKDENQHVLLEVDTPDYVNLKMAKALTSTVIGGGTYLIAGGLGDLGQRIGRLITQRGAKYIVYLSRRTVDPGKLSAINEDLRQFGAEVHVEIVSCDISQLYSLRAAKKYIDSLYLPPIRGLFQCAVVLNDGVLDNMTSDDFRVPLLTKLEGTRNLQQIFQSDDLEFFVMLSSLSGIVGSRGQANYAAGNAFQDALAHSMRGSSTHFMALDLGMITGTSAYDGNDARVLNLVRQGWIPCDSAIVNAFLDYSISPDARASGCHQAIIGVNGASIMAAESPTPVMQSALFSHVRLVSQNVGVKKAEAPKSLREELSLCASKSEVVDLIVAALIKALASLVAADPSALLEDTPLADIGLDSLTAIELKNWIAREIDVAVQTSEILDAPNIKAFAHHISDRRALLSPLARSREALNDTEINRPAGETSPDLPIVLSKPPPLPLPDLNSTTKHYIDAIRPFLTLEQVERTREMIKEFLDNQGPGLQQRLRARRENINIDAWAYDLYVQNIYLRNRAPLHPYSTFYGSYPPCAVKNTQSYVAACITRAALQFKEKLESFQLEPVRINDEPICNDSLQWLFNATREPHKSQDEMRKHPRSSHIAVLRRGNIHIIMFQGNPCSISTTKLELCFDTILVESSKILPPVAVLTADHRDRWAQNRQNLLEKSTLNKDLIRSVESAAFVICLDEEAPSTGRQRCDQFMKGPAHNRWSDKTLQFAICANGAAGHIMEHAGLDGISAKQLSNCIGEALTGSSPAIVESQTRTSLKRFIPTLDSSTTDEIESLTTKISRSYMPADFRKIKVPSLNSNIFGKNKISSRAGANVCIQLASRKVFGMQYPAWETVSMSTFYKGRLDWLQCVQESTRRFCDAATAVQHNSAATSELGLKALFCTAVTAHSGRLTANTRGRGFMAHMILLQSVLRDDEPMPALFEDETWKQTHMLASRKLKTDTLGDIGCLEAGFFMPDPEGFFVHYEVEDDGVIFWVQGSGDQLDGFVESLQWAADIIRRILLDPEE